MSDPTPEAAAAKPPKNTVVVILLVLNLLTVAGTAVYFIMFGNNGHAAAEHKEPEHPKHTLGPLLALAPLVANIPGADAEDESHFLKLSASLEVKDELAVHAVEAAMIPIRDQLLMQLSSMTMADTVGPDKRTKLQAKMVELANKAIGEPLVKRVFFTEFVVQ